MHEYDKAQSYIDVAVGMSARNKDFEKRKDILEYSEDELNGNVRSYNADVFITSTDAVADGWEIPIVPPEPDRCKYCGQELPYLGAKAINGAHKVIMWFEPVTCDCADAVKERSELRAEAERKKREQEELRRAEALRQKRERILKDSGMSPRFYERRFDTFELEDYNKDAFLAAKLYAEHFADMLPRRTEDWIDTPKETKNGLFVYGSQGTGKTHLAAAISNRLMDRGTAVICMTMIDLLARIKATFANNADVTSGEVLKLYSEVPLLVIDDLGSEQATEWGASTIFQIINARYEAYMPIIITTNYTGRELIARMTPPGSDGRNAEKTVDRLAEVCKPIKMSWSSYRRKRHDDSREKSGS